MIKTRRVRVGGALSALLLAPIAPSLGGCAGDDTNIVVDGGSDATTSPGDGAAESGATTSPGDGATESGAAGEGGAEGGVAEGGDTGTPSDAGTAGLDAGGHSPCVGGGALDPAADPCVETVCNGGDDFYCCTTSWDLSCVVAARGLCASECPSTPPPDGGVDTFGGTLHSIAQLASRDGAFCAVSVEGDVWCWGFEDLLGDGSEQPVPFPRKLAGLPPSQSVSMAGDAICALGVDGGVRCWGHAPVASKSAGAPILTPPSTPLLPNASAIAGDRILGTTDTSFLCAVVTGSVQCWGTTGSTLGPGVPNPTATPTGVDLNNGPLPDTRVTNVFAGAEDTCVLVGDGGTPLCWGANATGMLGHSGFGGAAPVVARLTCLPASNAGDGGSSDGGQSDCANSIEGIVKIAIGAASLCLLDSSHTVRCLGDNTDGELGVGTTGGAFPYAQAISGLTATDISVGATHACAAPLDASAPVVCWGSGADDQLGPGLTDGGSSASPLAVTGLSGVSQLTAATGATCALKSDGTVWCWGSNATGQLGRGGSGGSFAIPLEVPFVSFP